MTLQAYEKTQRQCESPRDAEYRLFGQVTHALIEADKADRTDLQQTIDALNWNRRLWSTLAVDCSSDANLLPANTRAQIISLSLWVSRFSSEVMRTRASLQPLIEVNRAIMQGLAQRPAA
jgi:flagellar protein FlaF